MMAEEWTKERLERYIEDGVQEDLNLDYKSSGSLSKTDQRKKAEVHKDVSAMANSAGGVIVYGVSEYGDSDHRHLPEKFDPIDQTVITKEWLEQIVSGIRPRVQNVVITPVVLAPDTNGVAYVIEISASNTAHQSSDGRYYKRYNFESVMMADHEIRDVMNRSSHAAIDVEFSLDLEHRTTTKTSMDYSSNTGPLGSFNIPKEKRTRTRDDFAWLNVYAKNRGATYAQYVVAHIYVPAGLPYDPNEGETHEGRTRVRLDNNQRHPSGLRAWQTFTAPILPGLREELGTMLLNWRGTMDEARDIEVGWEVFADNAQVRRGVIKLADLRIGATERHTTEEEGPFNF